MAGRSKVVFIALALLFSLYAGTDVQAQTRGNYEADEIRYEKGGQRLILLGDVKVDIEGVTITGEEITVDIEDRIVFTNKPFKINTQREGKNTEIIGKAFDFNISTRRIVTRNSSLVTDAQAPGEKIFISGEEITIYNEGERVSVVNGDFTTCDYIEEQVVPHYNLKAAIIDFYPNERVIAWNTSLYIMGGKNFWFPFWYIPLRVEGPDFNLDAGKNDTEGMFVNFRNYYNLNDYHDGTIFTRLMEKKWLGIGVEHTWLALPSSASYIYGYGNLLNTRYFQEPDAALKPNIMPVFEDREYYIRHEQSLPFLPYAQFNFTVHDRNFYNINSVLSPRDDFNEYRLDFTDREIFQPFQGININFDPVFNASYRQQRTSNVNNQKRIIPTDSNNVLNLSTNTTVKMNELNINLDSRYSNTIRNNLFREAGQPTSGTDNLPDVLNYYKSTDNIDFNNTLTLRTPIIPDLNLSGTMRYNNNDLRNFSQPTAANQPSIQTTTEPPRQQLNSQMTLSQNLGWGNLNLNMEHFTDFLQEDIFIRDSSGNIIPDSQLTPDQIAERDAAVNRRRSNSYINKLPELTLNVSPLLTEYVPINLSGSIGRYFESTSFSLNNINNRLLDLVRSEVVMDIGSKELDLGLGNKVNFGGSGYKQRFYQTQDAQYSVTGQFNYKNDLLPFFIPQLSYTKVITDEENNTPFSFDRLSRDRQDLFNSSVDIGNIPELKFRISNFGYDFQNKSFLNPIGVSLNSDFLAGARFSLYAQTGYSLNSITQADITRTNPNFQNKAAFQTDIENAQLTDEAFMDKYAGYSKEQARADLSLDETQLRAKYGIDNRLYDVDNREVIEDIRLTEDDIGRVFLQGGKINPVTFSFGVATPWEFGSDAFFGQEKDIPWGIAAKLDTNFSPAMEDFYKVNERGVGSTLTYNQNLANIMQKFQNTTLGTLFVIGGNWLTHTHIEFHLTLIPPELLAEGEVSRQSNRFLPFNTVISVKKDLHDFILSFDLQDQYVPSNNKRDFMFSLNLEMTAFPFSTRDLTGATRNLTGLTDQINNF